MTTMNDIAWEPWGDAAFARAAAEDKPILLSISAVWCHWCHVMDQTTYADPEVAAAVNAGFVPVRVDNDERPDINARYNMGGWPTTAFLTPDGSILTGATYLPAPAMQRALHEIVLFYREKKGDIAERARELREAQQSYTLAPPDDLRPELLDAFTRTVMEDYDSEYGGFGDAPKFPQPELHEYLLARWRCTNDASLYDAVAQTMRAMSGGGMYDRVEGGFFRYSTTRDWSVPHFEKMAEDHAGLLRVLAQLELWAPSQRWRDDLGRTIGYARRVLRDAQTGLFAGSQDADEAYYARDAAGRSASAAPLVDRRSYSNWSAAMAGAFAWCGLALHDRSLMDEALMALETLNRRLRGPHGLLLHVLPPGGEPRVTGLLGDQVAYIRALIDGYEALGERTLLARAVAHADATIVAFGAPDGGFYDRLAGEAVGRLDRTDRPLPDNGLMAENLLRLATLTGERRYRDLAERTLLLYAKTFERARSFAATYARALARYLARETTIRVTGPALETTPLRTAARRLPTPFGAIVSVPEGDPAAFVCVDTVCAAPVHEPDAVALAYATLP
jgi:uncharacterized protein YyaL (SSP411 family)